jgi:pyridoxine/pyridoxamine 5'-phosphate oxidase
MPQWKAFRAGAPVTGHTERLVREAWRHYYVARLAEAQFGPDSLEASIAHSQAMTSYRELRGTLRELDPYYRTGSSSADVGAPIVRHLKLVGDDHPEPEHQAEPQV